MKRPEECPVCGFSKFTCHTVPNADIYDIECPRCGKFKISEEAAHDLPRAFSTDRERANASGWVSENRGILIRLADIEGMVAIPTPSVAERADKLLLRVEREQSGIGGAVAARYNGTPGSAAWLSASWSNDPHDVTYLAEQFLTNAKGWLRHADSSGSLYQVTASGHEHIDELRRGRGTGAQGFCAMWFDASMNPVWTDAIELAIADAGYKPMRLDHHEHNNRIDDEIIAQIRRSKFLVADFTGHRGGVYFEAGLALGLGLQVIWTVREDDLVGSHFDTRQFNFIRWEADKLPEFRAALQNRIEATIGRGPLPDPGG